MSSIASVLPTPKHGEEKRNDERKEQESERLSREVALKHAIPPYGQRQSFRPQTQQDYGDGGAYPEIHIAQYPLDMGRKGKAKSSEGTLALKVDSEGKLDYDAIAKQGHEPGRVVQTSYNDLIPLRQRADGGDVSLSRPSEEKVKETTDRTKAAIDKILTGKIESSKPRAIAKGSQEATYVRYTPSNMMGESGDKKHRQRIIKMVDAAEDPLAPPKFKHKKVPAGPPSPPPPVLRSPPRKLTAKDQEDWYIPPSVSNWKNPKGFTIALDKRVAADGRGQEEVAVNDNKAKLAEALYAADRSAREEIQQRAAMQQKLAEKEQAAKEERLRELARKAREERSSAPAKAKAEAQPADNKSSSGSRLIEYSSSSDSESEDEETPEARKRAEMRAERRREAEKELRLSRMGAERRSKALANDRDISEKVALGVAKPSKPSGESQFDSRLFSQVSSTHNQYNEDQIYDKSLFAAREAVQSIYRPRGGAVNAEDEAEHELDRFSKEKRFKGLGGDASAAREGPVEFEKDEDPFGVNKMVKDVEYGLDDQQPAKKKHRTE
jgi:SNW domain-containing protein 1